jgi:hypothetical protein
MSAMRHVGCQRELIALVTVGVMSTGCFEESPLQRARAVCDAYCECAFTAGQVEQCVTEQCLPILPPVSDECIDCVVTNAQVCSALDNQCTNLCLP